MDRRVRSARTEARGQAAPSDQLPASANICYPCLRSTQIQATEAMLATHDAFVPARLVTGCTRFCNERAPRSPTALGAKPSAFGLHCQTACQVRRNGALNSFSTTGQTRHK